MKNLFVHMVVIPFIRWSYLIGGGGGGMWRVYDFKVIINETWYKMWHFSLGFFIELVLCTKAQNWLETLENTYHVNMIYI